MMYSQQHPPPSESAVPAPLRLDGVENVPSDGCSLLTSELDVEGLGEDAGLRTVVGELNSTGTGLGGTSDGLGGTADGLGGTADGLGGTADGLGGTT